MAAGHQKKRLTSSNLCEQYKVKKKKKKVDSSDYVLNLKPHIYLKWNDHQKRTVAKREQVGITWTDMAPFVDSTQLQSGLADVISVPEEIFALENLTEVLSYEVWATCLSEPERKLLSQFLPSVTAPEQVVQSLLMGENHHFGNPFIKWSTSLCSGNLHPDDALCVERQYEANKKAYYIELKKYHTDMLEVLKKWKDIWASCEDPEKLSKAFTKPKKGSLTLSAERAKADFIIKKEMPHKSFIRYGDGAKYMSCIKISKKQHELIKSMKHSGDGIQSKSLSRLLGDMKSYNMQPYEAFEEEEKKRLHEHWFRLANNDVIATFEDRRSRKLQREQYSKVLEQELAAKIDFVYNKDMGIADLGSPVHEQSKCEDLEHHSVMSVPDEEEDESNVDSARDHHLERIPSLNSHQDISSIGWDQEAVAQDASELTNNCFGRSGPVEDIMDQEADGDDAVKPTDNIVGRTNPSEDTSDQRILESAGDFFGRTNPAEATLELKAPIAISKEMWQAVNNHGPYNQTNLERHGFTSGGLSLRQSQTIKDQRTSVIDLERDILQQHNREYASAASIHLENEASLFSSYANQGRNEHLPTVSKNLEMLSSYPHEHLNELKQSGMQFLMATESLPGSRPFSNPFQDQQHHYLEHRQVREKDLYMHQMMNGNTRPCHQYTAQVNFSPVDEHNLPLMQSSTNATLMSHNWLASEYRASSGWPQSSHQLSNNGSQSGGSAADGSLFSVLSACKMTTPRMPYDITRSEQFIQARNFASGGIPTNNNIYAYSPNQLTSSSSHDATTVPPSLKVDNVSWMNSPHQNHGRQDLAGKQFRRPWNQ